MSSIKINLINYIYIVEIRSLNNVREAKIEKIIFLKYIPLLIRNQKMVGFDADM